MSRTKPILRARLPRVLVLTALGLLCCGGMAQAAPEQPPAACTQGEFCSWADEFYGGHSERFDLRIANPGECIPLPNELEARSFVNRMDRDVTVYQGRDCSTEGDFTTYPGHGTFVPQARYVIRAIQIWE
ncbi:peptidase inhibitor family I36 protein [Amycolatopsis sp. CA-230715]|uniref:peptidase inhibitor family I36 protein n=1 Tax=Amycolatopsis sp. CA-230715 TaxID=2745196 RepID=UPI001C0270BD|nr:peptidase inhibitor family I36 protein [Amycolatopsis sp. CA-230715]QWF83448.1 hypothetical protein HUW46_06889 [Amycolatopsis sp. CA-230715]